MRKSNLFLGITILVSTLILIIYGIAALSPINPKPTDTTDTERSLPPLEAPTITFGNPTKGPKNAKVVVYVFGDYQCAPCAEFETAINQMLADFPNDVRLVWKDMPNAAQHPEAINAAVAARCADDQGGFWQYHDVLMQNQGSLGPKNYVPFAAQLGLDLQTFQSCFDSLRTKPLVQRDYDEGQRLKIDSTPYTFVNKRRVTGAISYEQLRGFVEAAIAEAAAPAPQQ
ncbi:MAG TPA: thioredoxin domain-containing protein [Patescibacteria group bacterium]|nr:thioredoxin domain-containing protein [Patescibacteria group bacterium]